MTRNSVGMVLRAARLLQQQTRQLDESVLQHYVKTFLDRRELFLEAARSETLPLYVIDTAALEDRARLFRKAFGEVGTDLKVFFALKSNSHPLVAATLLDAGLGLDVSSGLELETALELDAESILFSGPGKQPAELELALQQADRVIVLLDSFAELARLERVAAAADTVIRAGVRLTTDENGIWRKFGIGLGRLEAFLGEAEHCPHVKFCGLQYHISWNLNPERHLVFLARLGAALHRLPGKYRARIRFIDIGGGYWPEEGEWLQPAGTPSGMVRTALDEPAGPWSSHYRQAASSIEAFAAAIGQGLKKHLPDDLRYALYTEPGRWLCHHAMHILLTVVDRKAPDLVITDGGTNAVGWERFETDYFPVINLSRPGLRERPCLVGGSLCTPHDIWGYSYFGETIREGDILLIPNQGAYTYSLRQEFIKPLPGWVELTSEG